MRNMRKLLVVFLAMLFFGSLIVPNFGGAQFVWTEDVMITNIELDPPIKAWDDSYANNSYWVKVTVENSGETKLTDLNVTCTITSASTTYLDEYNITVTELGIWDTVEVMFHWMNIVTTQLYTINTSVVADSFGTAIGPDYMEIDVYIDNTTSYDVPTELTVDPSALKLLVGAVEAMPAYGGAWALYDNNNGVFNLINYTPQVKIINDGNQDIANLNVEASFYDAPDPTGLPSSWTGTTTVTGLQSGLQTYADFTPNSFNGTIPGIKTLNVSVDGLNYTINFVLWDILDVNVTEFVGLMGGMVYNNFTGDVQVMVKNSGNINLSAIGDFSAQLTISDSSGPQYTSALVPVNASDAGQIYMPGQSTPITFANINMTFPDRLYYFNVSLLGVNDLITNGTLANNMLSINFTLMNVTDASIWTTMPLPGKYDVNDIGGMVVEATVFNDGTRFAIPDATYFLEVSYENMDTGEVWANVTNDTADGPIMPLDYLETDLGFWLSLLNYNADFEVTVDMYDSEGGTLLDSDTVQITLAGGLDNGTLSGQVTGVTHDDQVMVKAYTVGGTTPTLEVMTTGTDIDRDYSMDIFGSPGGEIYEIKVLQADNYWYADASATPDPEVMSGRGTPGVDIALTELGTGRIQGEVTLEAKLGYPDLDPDLTINNVTNAVVAVEGTPVSASPDHLGMYDEEAVVGTPLNVSAAMANFMGDYDDNVTVTADVNTTEVNFTLMEMWDVMVTPANDAIDVVKDTTVVAVFANAMNTSTVDTSTFSILHGTPATLLTGLNDTHYLWDDNNMTCTITLTEDLLGGETYYVEITADVNTSLDAPALHRTWYSMFTVEVGYGHISGYVTDVVDNSPIVGANVSIGAISGFTDANGTYTLMNILPGAQTVVATATWYEDGTLTDAVIIPGDTIINQNISMDRVPPMATVTPSDGSVDVAATTSIVAIFDNEMNESTITTDTFTLMETDTDTTVAGTITASSDNKTFTFTPDGDLTGETNYTIGLSKTIKEFNVTADWYNWDLEYMFKTGLVVLYVIVETVSPASGAIDVPINTDIEVTFDTPIDDDTFAISISGGITLGTPAWSNTNMTATIIPGTDLENDTTYTVTITIADELGGDMILENDYAWSFTTVAGPQTVSILLGPYLDKDNKFVKGAKVTITVDGVKYGPETTSEVGMVTFTDIPEPVNQNIKVKVTHDDYEDLEYTLDYNDGLYNPVPTKKLEETDDGGLDTLAIIAIIIVIIIIIILLALAMKPKKPAEEELEKEEEEEAEEEEEEFECPECGAVVNKGESVCPECGAEFEEEEFECPECGASVEPGTSTCPECGAEFEEEELEEDLEEEEVEVEEEEEPIEGEEEFEEEGEEEDLEEEEEELEEELEEEELEEEELEEEELEEEELEEEEADEEELEEKELEDEELEDEEEEK